MPATADAERRAAMAAAVAVVVPLLVAYVVTLAPSVTYWDSGEFLAAVKTLGIPHPPGTPLYILLANVWAQLFSPVLGYAYAVNLFSAATTASACGVFTWLMAKWTRDPWSAAAGGLLAGLMSSVWLNANETEVYAPSLLVSALLLLVAEKARANRDPKLVVLLGYLAGLGWALQLSALVAAPAAALLASGVWRGGSGVPVAGRRKTLRLAMQSSVMFALGASAVIFMLIRASHDPGVNQGNPDTWRSLIDVITRVQYQPVPVFPRQAPLYIQIANLFEYSDWQLALGLAPDAPPSWRRTPFTLVYAALGVVGFAWHRLAHRVSWRVMSVLFVCATLGVIVYLNMKAGPSFGFGYLPEGAKHEARERDYFFALAFVCWGLWAGAGAMRLLARGGGFGRAAGLTVAVLPAFLNGAAVDRSRAPLANAAADSARRILLPAPPRAVVFAYGDNDTYPGWFAQQVEGTRRDVTLVTIPLLGARWYRAELARREQLLPPQFVEDWRGPQETIIAICKAAAKNGRPIVAKPVHGSRYLPGQCTVPPESKVGQIRGDRLMPHDELKRPQ